MKIDPTLKTVAPSAIHEQRLHNEKAPGQPGTKPRGDVELSSLSTQLHEIEAGMDKGQAVDSSRVVEVKRAIADGSFEIDAEKIADRLIDATREFLRSHKS
jgi:negative regulator of flagellin synthesis FlgM